MFKSFVLFAFAVLVGSFVLNGNEGQIPKWIQAIAGATSALGGVWVAWNWFVHGAPDQAKQNARITRDPLEREVNLFNSIVKKIGAPVCIFIDDLDRCDTDFVIDLLEGIQSAFRHKDVVYVVAADKSWIRSAFETKYKSFDGEVSRPGQPLGYLFLEKIFQMSVPVPGISQEVKQGFVNHKTNGAAEVALASEPGRENEDNEEKERGSATFERELAMAQASPRGVTGDRAREIIEFAKTPEQRQELIRVFGESAEAQERQQSLLADYVEYLPDNPRLMVRMVNTFSMRNIVGFIEGAKLLSDRVVARWVVLEQRYPALADLLVEHPEWVDVIREATPPENDKKDDNEDGAAKDEEAVNIVRKDVDVPQGLKPFIGLPKLMDIIGAKGIDDALTFKRVEEITRGSRN